MVTAIIVVAAIVAYGLISYFIYKGVSWHRAGNKFSWAGVGQWFVNHKPSKRRLIQVYAMLLYNANIKGYVRGTIYQSPTTKYMCVPGLNCYSCPGAVGACPLGSLQNALADTKTTAPYYVLGIIGLLGIMLGRTICGFLCPVGMAQELLYKVRTPKVKKSRVTRVLSYFKYVLLALTIALPIIYAFLPSSMSLPLPAFCKYICPAGTFEGAILLLANPNGMADFTQLGAQFTWKFCLLVAFITASVFIYRVFCRFICPLGAIYGFFNRFAILGVKVEKSDCTSCGKCVNHCKMDVKKVGDHECINCGECISVCPTKAIRWKGSKIFLRGNEVNMPATETVKPMTVTAGGAVVLGGAPIQSEPTQETETEVTENNVTPENAVNENIANQAVAATVTTDANDGKKKKIKKEKKAKAKRPAKFWVEMTAWIVAGVVLIGALVYYNFIDTENASATGYHVGEVAPDFTLSKYGEDGEYNLYENRGKITVISFWSKDDADSIAQIEYLNTFASEHSDYGVVAVHTSEDATEFITASGWGENALTFVQDKMVSGKPETFNNFGGKEFAFTTVVLSDGGTVLYNKAGLFGSYAQLEVTIVGLDTEIEFGYNVGDRAPDFTVTKYREDGEFNLYDNLGKVTVVNFWATWCTPCVAELPYFNEYAAAHPEVNVVAIHGTPANNVEGFIENKGWSEYALTFAQDNLNGQTCLTYQLLGGNGDWPRTVIIGEDGTVLYNSGNSFESCADLEKTVAAAIGNNQ